MTHPTTINTTGRYTSAGRLYLVTPIHEPKSDDVASARYLTSLSATCWTLLVLEDLGLPSWAGMGDRPRVAYLWASVDDDGRILRLVPAENVAGFMPEPMAPAKALEGEQAA